MNGSRGYAVVVAMLVLIVLSAIGMYVASLPLPVGQSQWKHELEAVARNMAKAGAHAAIARLPEVIPDVFPYVRRFPVMRDITGRYSVTSRRTGTAATPGSSVAAGEEEYEMLSQGSIDQAPGVKYRVRLVVRFSPSLARGRITQWEETALP